MQSNNNLQHILSHYNSTLSNLLSPARVFSHTPSTSFASHTYFLQPHLAWQWLARPRLQLVTAQTGFAHFGPYARSACGHEISAAEYATDGRPAKPAGTIDDGIFMPFIRDLFEIFTGSFCVPGEEQLVSTLFVSSAER